MFLEFADDGLFVGRRQGWGVQNLVQFGVFFEDFGEGENRFCDGFEGGGFGCGGVLLGRGEGEMLVSC